MRKSRFLSPYTKEGKTRFPLRGKPGVYLIRSVSGQYLYIGFSSTDVYKTCYRHFQVWNSRYQDVVTYAGQLDDVVLRIVYCTAKQAEALEKKLIWKHSPRDNKYDYLDRYLQEDYYEIEVFDKYLATETQSFAPARLEWSD